MTVELPWTSVGVAICYVGNPRISAANSTTHGISTETVTVVGTACATVLSVANSVASTMATHGSARQSPRLPGNFPRTSAAIATR